MKGARAGGDGAEARAPGDERVRTAGRDQAARPGSAAGAFRAGGVAAGRPGAHRTAGAFAMTAFKNLPPWGDFVKGRDSDMLRMRLDFTRSLEQLHRRTLAKHSAQKTPELEQAAQEAFRAHQVKRRKFEGPLMSCPCWQALH